MPVTSITYTKKIKVGKKIWFLFQNELMKSFGLFFCWSLYIIQMCRKARFIISHRTLTLKTEGHYETGLFKVINST